MSARRNVIAIAVLGLFLAVAAAAAWAAVPPPEPVRSETVAGIKPSFSPDKLGARTSATFSIHFSGGTEGIPQPVKKAVVQLPAGLGLQFPATLGCTRAHLLAHGPKGCPPNSLIGHGHALAEIQLGAVPQTEEATVTAFVGPLQNGQPTIEVLGQGYTPLTRKVVFTMTLMPDHKPYWAKLVGTIPPVPTIPLEPNASVINFSLTIGIAGRAKQAGSIGIFVPKHCPSGGFPWAAEFTYADGSVGESTAKSPCP